MGESMNQSFMEEHDHVKRNQIIASKYREMTDMRHMVNQDTSVMRQMNSQQKVQILDNEKRLKSVEWLNKWEQFRQIKS